MTLCVLTVVVTESASFAIKSRTGRFYHSASPELP